MLCSARGQAEEDDFDGDLDQDPDLITEAAVERLRVSGLGPYISSLRAFRLPVEGLGFAC